MKDKTTYVLEMNKREKLYFLFFLFLVAQGGAHGSRRGGNWRRGWGYYMTTRTLLGRINRNPHLTRSNNFRSGQVLHQRLERVEPFQHFDINTTEGLLNLHLGLLAGIPPQPSVLHYPPSMTMEILISKSMETGFETKPAQLGILRPNRPANGRGRKTI